MKISNQQSFDARWLLASVLVCLFSSEAAFAQQSVNFNASASANLSLRVPINAPDPVSVFVPCTDENKADPDHQSDLAGPAEFGQRRCTAPLPKIGVKEKLKADLKEKVGHIVSYYYDGKQIEFTDKSPVGFCVSKGNLKTPVCEISKPGGPQFEEVIENNHEGTRTPCGQRPAPDRTQDSACFRSTKQQPPRAGSVQVNGIDDVLCGSDRFGIGMAVLLDEFDKIARIQQILADPTNPEFELSPDAFIRGIQIQGLQNALADAQDFVVNINRRESRMMSKWNDFVSDTSGLCKFSKRGFNPLSCSKEFAWARGMRVSALEEAREEVNRQIDSGTLTLTQFGQDRPCAETALNLLRILDGDARPPAPGKPDMIGIRAAEAQVRARYGVYTDTAALDIKNKTTKDGCLGLEEEIGSTPEQAIQKALTALEEAFKNENGNGIEAEKKHISVATCNLAFARMQSEVVFSKLAVCEVSMRAKKKYFEESAMSSAMFKEVTDQVIRKCSDYANDQAGLFCWEGCVTDAFYDCYKNGKPGRNILPVAEVIKNFAKSRFNQTEAAPHIKLQKLHPDRAVASDGAPLDLTNIPNCGALGLSLIPFGGKARRQYRKNKRKVLLALLVTALLVLVSLGSGCAEAELEDALDEPADVLCMDTTLPSTRPGGTVNRCAPNDEACNTLAAADCAGAGEDPGSPDFGGGNLEGATDNVGAIIDIRADDGNSLVKKNPAKKQTNQAQNAATAAFRDGKNSDGNLRVSFKDGKGADGRFGSGGAKGKRLDTNGFSNGGDGSGLALSPDGDGFGKYGSEKADDEGKGNGSDDANRGLASGGYDVDGSGSQSRGGSGSGMEYGGAGGPGGSTDSQLDNYFEKNGKLSLFEVVSRRYGIWSWELENKQKHSSNSGSGGAH